MSSVEEHFATLQALRREGGWLTDRFHQSAAIFLAAHLDELEVAWRRDWKPIDTAPKDRPIVVFASGKSPRWPDDLGDLVCITTWHPDGGFCVCELREATLWTEVPA